MAVSLLGPVLVDGAGELSRRDRVVLSALAVRSGDVLSAEQLADVLWGEDPPASWPKVVQGCVSRLRRALGRDAVQTTSGGYRLALADDEIDLRRFEGLIARARELAGRGEHDRAAALFEQSLAMWRGSPLGDLEGWSDGRSEAGRLEELRLSAQESLLVERAAAGRDVVADASALVAAQPLREARWHLLAVALYRAGRQSDALAALRGARRTLQDELGLDPGQELVELERAILTHDADLAAPAVLSLPDTGVCPYQGLLVYGRADADRFFGRDQETVACLRILRDSSLLVVAGPSGCGKSSLVRAGVVPRVERSGGKVVLITPGAQPAATLAGALAMPGRDLVMVVDQLEELFTGGQSPGVVAGFLDDVARTAASGRGVVLVVRADQLGGFSRSPAVARLVESGLHLVTSMTQGELREAIEGPARQAGLRLEPGLVELLVRDVETEPGALPLLSHALAETWVRREAGVLTVDGYRATGGIQGAVAQSAEAMWESLPAGQQAAVQALLLRLVTMSPEGEPAAARASLVAINADPGRTQLLDLLVRCRLVTTDDKTVTLAHEALARAWPRLRSWLDEDAAGHLLLRHITVAGDDWQARGRPDSELYRGARLTSALDWRTRATPSLTTTETEFLNASQALAAAERHAARTRARRQRIALAGTALGLVVALIAGLVAVQQSRQSERTARTALVDQLVAQSVALRATRRDVAALLAVEAYRLRHSAATRSALLGIFTAAPGLLGFHHVSSAGDRAPLTSGAILSDGLTLVAVGVDGVARLINLRTGQTQERFPRPALAPLSAQMDLSSDQRTLAVVSWEGPAEKGGRATLDVYDMATRRRRLPDTRLPLDVGAVAVSPSGRFVAVSGYRDGYVLIYDLQDRARLPELLNVTSTAPGVHILAPVGSAPAPFDGERHTAALTFREDGLLLAGSEVGVVRLVDPATGRVVQRFTGAPDLTSNNAIALSQDETVMVSAGTRGVAGWDLQTGRQMWFAGLDENRCRTVAVTGRSVLCGGLFASVEQLALESGSPTGTRYDMQHGQVSALVLTPDHDTLVELSDSQPVVARWRLDGTGPITRLLAAHGAPLGYDAGGTLLLVRGTDQYISVNGYSYNRPPLTVIDARTSSVVDRLGLDRVAPVWTQRPGRLVAWQEAGPASTFDVVAHRMVGRAESGIGGPPTGTAVAPSGRRLLAWAEDSGDPPIWEVLDLPSGEAVGNGRMFRGHQGTLGPRGRIMLWSGDGQVVTYDLRSRHTLARRSLLSAAVSPLGVVTASSADGRLGFYKFPSLRPTGSLPGTPGVVQQFAFSRDGRLFVARGGDDAVRLVDMASRTQIGESIKILADGPRDIALRPDGMELAEPTSRGIALWDLQPQRWLTAACRFAGRNLTREEWTTYLPSLGNYHRTCRPQS